MRKILLLSVGFLLLFNFMVVPQSLSTESLDDAKQLVELMHYKKAINQIMLKTFRRTEEEYEKHSKIKSVPIKALKITDDLMYQFFLDRMEKPGALIDQLAADLRSRFTEPEMRKMIVFFKTPVGQKYLTSKREIDASIGKIYLSWMQSLKTEVYSHIQSGLRQRGY
ncbi:DUF2059 domain-containing protein [Dethiosulfatarculus sandiegensis]|uniref:DUF2059 domain-containing protein n=1 Tax=Dethiosulfatarculus sandiegensis TaxID=1429043 RepID=A0A0D2JV60_9BACT|nr:DUF2059 domain-containing protein [Dethiosulfatarculus sandiegensis]KIX13445.1 hypothetical protein X474_13250 [Dethiosulfatarculus sandiegensis]